MDTNNIINTPAAPVAPPVAAPVAPATPPPVAAPAAMPVAAPVMGEGGAVSSDSSSGGIKGFFEGITVLDVAFMALGAATLFYTIYFYRQTLRFRKSEYLDLVNRMDKQEAQLSAIKKTTAKVAAAGKMGANGIQGFSRRG